MTLTRVRVSGSVEQPIPQQGPTGCTLDDYMRLPVAQYSTLQMPFQASLERVPGTVDVFELRVPPVRFGIRRLSLTVVPSLVATANAEADRVLISSDACELSGSPLIERLRLNERFDFRVRTEFTWAGEPAMIRSETRIEVDVDPPGPFARLPRSLLETTGNAVMSFAMDALQAAFLRSLADDYARWSVDEGYREARNNFDR